MERKVKCMAVAMAAAICLMSLGNAGAQPKKIPDRTFTVCDTTRAEGTVRLLYWNIQNGMWADQPNNYDTFVSWVKSFDPDICVWCEASTIYYDESTKSKPKEERYLPDGWAELAARYGHSYVALGGWRDNYPQVITSKYPIETLLKITDTDEEGRPVMHGAALQSVNVDGEEIYFVTLHTYPFAYAPGTPKERQEESKAAYEGEQYRRYEIEYICSKTVNDPQYASQGNWVMLGDFNSISPLDDWHYRLGPDAPDYLTQSYIVYNTSLTDVIAHWFHGQFVSSTQGGRRIDYVHASKPMYDRIDKAVTITDEYTVGVKAEGLSNFWYPSDHLPIMVDFRK